MPRQRQAFQHMARHIFPLSLNLLGNIVRLMNCDFHSIFSRVTSPLSMPAIPIDTSQCTIAGKPEYGNAEGEAIAAPLNDQGVFSFIPLFYRGFFVCCMRDAMLECRHPSVEEAR